MLISYLLLLIGPFYFYKYHSLLFICKLPWVLFVLGLLLHKAFVWVSHTLFCPCSWPSLWFPELRSQLAQGFQWEALWSSVDLSARNVQYKERGQEDTGLTIDTYSNHNEKYSSFINKNPSSTSDVASQIGSGCSR